MKTKKIVLGLVLSSMMLSNGIHTYTITNRTGKEVSFWVFPVESRYEDFLQAYEITGDIWKYFVEGVIGTIIGIVVDADGLPLDRLLTAILVALGSLIAPIDLAITRKHVHPDIAIGATTEWVFNNPALDQYTGPGTLFNEGNVSGAIVQYFKWMYYNNPVQYLTLESRGFPSDPNNLASQLTQVYVVAFDQQAILSFLQSLGATMAVRLPLELGGMSWTTPGFGNVPLPVPTGLGYLNVNGNYDYVRDSSGSYRFQPSTTAASTQYFGGWIPTTSPTPSASSTVALSLGNVSGLPFNQVTLHYTTPNGAAASKVVWDPSQGFFPTGGVICNHIDNAKSIDQIEIGNTNNLSLAGPQSQTDSSYAVAPVGGSDCDSPSSCSDPFTQNCQRSPVGRAVHFNVTNVNGKNNVSFTGPQYCGFNGC